MKYLGEQFDIHTGGEDHLPIHHPNEIAQSEKPDRKKAFCKILDSLCIFDCRWHQMSKSLGKFVNLSDVIKKDL